MNQEMFEEIREGLHAKCYDTFHRLFIEFGSTLNQAIAAQFPGHRTNIVDDAVQEAFLVLWQEVLENKVKQFDTSKHLYRYLFVIAYRSAYNLYRCQPRHSSLTEQHAPIIRGRNAIESLEDREKWDQIKRAIDQLPTHERIVIQMHYEDGLTYKEIAEKLQVLSEETIRSRNCRGMKQLREILSSTVQQVEAMPKHKTVATGIGPNGEFQTKVEK